jgi:hypothetical protein
LPGALRAAEYQQKKGAAVLRIEADVVKEDRIEVRRSEEIFVRLSLEGRPTLEVEPLPSITASEAWQLRRASKPQTTPLGEDRVRWQQTFLVTPQQSGEVMLQPAPLRYRDAGDNGWKPVEWQPIPFMVRDEVLTAELSELRDEQVIPEQVAPAPSWRRPLLWSGAALLTLLLSLGLLIFVRRRAGRPAPLPPYQWALREIERLRPTPLTSAEEVERYHRLLSDVLRRYLELRFHLPALEQTTAEFLQTMRNSPELTAAQQELLREFLERCDLVKFARILPEPAACQAVAEMARRFVEETAHEAAQSA